MVYTVRERESDHTIQGSNIEQFRKGGPKLPDNMHHPRHLHTAGRRGFASVGWAPTHIISTGLCAWGKTAQVAVLRGRLPDETRNAQHRLE